MVGYGGESEQRREQKRARVPDEKSSNAMSCSHRRIVASSHSHIIKMQTTYITSKNDQII